MWFKIFALIFSSIIFLFNFIYVSLSIYSWNKRQKNLKNKLKEEYYKYCEEK